MYNTRVQYMYDIIMRDSILHMNGYSMLCNICYYNSIHIADYLGSCGRVQSYSVGVKPHPPCHAHDTALYQIHTQRDVCTCTYRPCQSAIKVEAGATRHVIRTCFSGTLLSWTNTQHTVNSQTCAYYEGVYGV